MTGMTDHRRDVTMTTVMSHSPANGTSGIAAADPGRPAQVRPTDGPLVRALLGIQFLRPPRLLGGRSIGGKTGAAYTRPRRASELVQPVVPVTSVGRRVSTRLTLGNTGPTRSSVSRPGSCQSTRSERGHRKAADKNLTQERSFQARLRKVSCRAWDWIFAPPRPSMWLRP